MELFCKIVESEKFGQFLIQKKVDGDDFPCVEITFLIGEIRARPEYSFKDEDEDEAWSKVDKTFDGLNVETCEAIAEDIANTVSGLA